jgi:hypothetical protein
MNEMICIEHRGFLIDADHIWFYGECRKNPGWWRSDAETPLQKAIRKASSR